MKLSIVIVNYNGRDFLRDCLISIKNNVDVEHEIIIIDNDSTDGSVEYLKKCFPDINLIESNSNIGFAAGNNRAV